VSSDLTPFRRALAAAGFLVRLREGRLTWRCADGNRHTLSVVPVWREGRVPALRATVEAGPGGPTRTLTYAPAEAPDVARLLAAAMVPRGPILPLAWVSADAEMG
jgi:hypothetical protein